MRTKVKTSLSLSRGTLRRIKREAKLQRRSVSQIVEFWIEQALRTNEPQQAPAAPAVVFSTGA